MKPNECVTHHLACDCREAKFEALTEENERLKELVREAKFYVDTYDNKVPFGSADASDWFERVRKMMAK